MILYRWVNPEINDTSNTAQENPRLRRVNCDATVTLKFFDYDGPAYPRPDPF
jgi:hypothetical protein